VIQPVYIIAPRAGELKVTARLCESEYRFSDTYLHHRREPAPVWSWTLRM